MRWGTPHRSCKRVVFQPVLQLLVGQLSPLCLPFSISPHTHTHKIDKLSTRKEMDVRRDFQKILDMYWVPLPCLQAEFSHLSLSQEKGISTRLHWEPGICSLNLERHSGLLSIFRSKKSKGQNCGRHIAMRPARRKTGCKEFGHCAEYGCLFHWNDAVFLCLEMTARMYITQ